MMAVNLPLPVGRMPVCKVPAQRCQAAIPQQLVQALEAQAEQTTLAHPGYRPMATSEGLIQEFSGDLHASVEDDTSGQSHTHQQTPDVVQVSDLALHPHHEMPAPGQEHLGFARSLINLAFL